ncbi:magnesium transporter CorA family protein [Sulfurivermis fontis]|jgi:magnesium/cobalt transport protein CorA|uniref:magnesium transporter CorA family protein n=1 Tax=Sulfurivermis fontis TaxID=1972068 RepID=UPI000FD97D5C|nr:magnesium transporter CorA family protein [Sulfurivermis fontis]
MDIIQLSNGTPQRLDRLSDLPQEGFLWLDFTRDLEPDWYATVEQLTERKIHERHINDSFNTAHPSFFDATSDYDMVIFRSLAPELEEGEFATRPIAFFLFERLLVTIQPGDSRSLQGVKERLLRHTGRVPIDPAGLMHMLLSTMVDRFLALREPLTLQMEEWATKLLNPRHPFDDWYLVMGHRSQLRRLEILCDEQEDAVLAWRDSARDDISEHLNVRYTDLLEHIRRVTKFALTQQHEVESLVQLHFSAVAHRTNEIIRVLTVVTVIFMPLTLIAGIYGMNFDNIPELHTRYGYFVVIGGMLLLAAALLLLFRLKKWF